MKRKTLVAIIVILAALLLASAAFAADRTSEARSMLNLINEFRTGGDAWYWNKDNVTWTTVTGLKKLQYDLELEAVAKLRAEEISTYFSHTRPDGSKWSTAFPAGNYAKAENLAWGPATAAEAFTAFLETNEGYAGQGHRRNMLRKDMTRVGIACLEINGNIYWVQEFASGKVKSAAAAEEKEEEEESSSGETGWVEKSGTWYYNDAQGNAVTGWQMIDGKWYYFSSNGAMQTGWKELGGSWYYFRSSGAMVTGTVTIDGQKEVFGPDGAWQYSEISDYDTPLGLPMTADTLMKVFLVRLQMFLGLPAPAIP